MNAIPSSSAEASATFDQITLNLAALAQASGRSQEVLTRQWTFRQMAATMLRERIDAVRRFTGLPVSNPDAIFLNRVEDDGTLSTRAMTDVLIDTARQGMTALDLADGVFCSRHDSVDTAHVFTSEQAHELKALVDEFAQTLVVLYEHDLREFWQRNMPDPADPQRTESVARLLIDLHRTALQSEIELLGYSKLMTPPEQARLSALLDDDVSQGVFTLSWMTADEKTVQLPSVYCVSAIADGQEQPSGVVFVLMPGQGIERFDSLDSLREALSQRLTDTDANHGLREVMSFADQARLVGLDAVDPLAWTFEALDTPLLDTHLQALQRKQTEDFSFVLSDASDANLETFNDQLDQVSTCAHLDDAMGHRFKSLTLNMQVRVQPQWRKYANEEKRQELVELEQAHHQRKKRVEERLDGFESLERFARDEIIAYMRQHLGCFIDPVNVQVSFEDSIDLGQSAPLKATYKKSLLEFAVQGAPDGGADLVFSPVAPRLHAEFSNGFVRTMIQELNLVQRYALLLEQQYADEETLRLMVGHRDSAIALSACAALMQGHMVDDRSHELLHLIRGDMRKEGSTYSMGSLHLMQTDSRFRDVIVFVDRTGPDEHFVLYAPGAAGGQDFFEYGSWRQLVHGVGQWLATDAGRSYVHDQLAGPGETARGDFINNVVLKPTLWTADSCVFVPCTGENFQSNLTDLVAQKALFVVQAAERLAPYSETMAPYANPSILSFVESRMEALGREFTRLTPQLIPFTDYAHQQASQALNDFLRNQGYTREIDPDTLYLGLGLAYSDSPDFSEHSALHSLTHLMMYGAEDILSYRPDVHLYSSTGLDVTQLPVNIFHFLDKQIREADLGARYMTLLEREFLLRDNPLYDSRKALLVKRVQYEMIHGALSTFLKGHLDEQQYTWLRQTISELETSKPIGSKNKRVCTFKIAGHIIEGVHIFRDFDSEDPRFNLLYTPDSPDGICFRPLTDYAELLGSAAMQHYCYARVAYKGQPFVGTFLDEFERGKKHDPDFITIDYEIFDAISDARRLYADRLERLINDVDAQTDSTAEKRFSLAWTIIRWTGTVLLLPFPSASFSWGLLTTTVTFSQAIQAYTAGDRATALPLLIFGTLGVISGVDGARALIADAHTLAASVALKGAAWAWRKLEFGSVFAVVA